MSVFYGKVEYSYIYRMSRGECARHRENVPYVKVHRSNPKHLYPKLNGYGDMAREKCGLLAVPRTVPVSHVVTRTLRMSVLESGMQSTLRQQC